METLIIVLIVAAALLYVGRNLSRQFTGKGGCSSGCSCSAELKHHCTGTPNIQFEVRDD